jgi:UDP-hydrolysing UDP-N-acetyl-D-glucosamine 2-epimerase
MLKFDEIVFFGNWGAGAQALKKILESGYAIKAVVTQYDPDKDETDGYFNAVQRLAAANRIPTYRCYGELPEAIISEKTMGLSVAFDQIFNESFLEKLRIINFHPSLLPDYRGPTPIHWQLMDRKSDIGMTAHMVDSGIDSGPILSQDKFRVDYEKRYDDFLDDFNRYLSDFVVETLEASGNRARTGRLKSRKTDYKCKLPLPDNLYSRKLKFISDFLNRPKIAFFTGNRAEFGILFPLIHELSKEYFLDIFVSGAHLIEPWKSIDDIHEKIAKYRLPVRILPVPLEEGRSPYLFSLPSIYSHMIEHFERYRRDINYKFSVILGDRIETLGFALASFYSKIPIIHICGGDVANVPFFDTNVRHSISKIAHIHFATNEHSQRVLEGLGEEPWRIFNTGNLSYSYEGLGLLEKPENLAKEFDLSSDSYLIICTFHPSHQKSSRDNLADFQTVIRAIKDFDVPIIITYPNNDKGSDSILSSIDGIIRRTGDRKKKIRLITSLGTAKYLSLLKNFKSIVVGNSSSGLTETALYAVPVLNIGNRQTDRIRADNVFDCEIDRRSISECLGTVMNTYDLLKSKFSACSKLFGDSESAARAKQIIDMLIEQETDRLLFKKFVTEKNETIDGSRAAPGR